MNTKTRTTLAGTALLALALLSACGAAQPTAPPAAAAAAAPAVAAPAPAPNPAEVARAEAVGLLGAAGSARQAGDLGIAWELARQAVAKSPDYAEASAFLREVETEKRYAERDAAREAARPKTPEAQRKEFLLQVRLARITPGIVYTVNRGPAGDDELEVRVGRSWSSQSFSYRLRMADEFYLQWLGLHSPGQPRGSRIRLVEEETGKWVGGNFFQAGEFLVSVPR